MAHETFFKKGLFWLDYPNRKHFFGECVRANRFDRTLVYGDVRNTQLSEAFDAEPLSYDLSRLVLPFAG